MTPESVAARGCTGPRHRAVSTEPRGTQLPREPEPLPFTARINVLSRLGDAVGLDTEDSSAACGFRPPGSKERRGHISSRTGWAGASSGLSAIKETERADTSSEEITHQIGARGEAW